MSKNRIIIFVKNTIKGKVKTRLAKTLGDDEALAVYKELLAITKANVEPLEVEKEVWYAWHTEERDVWDDDIFNKKVQVEGDLGQKMSQAFASSFNESCEKVVLIGSDCPTITTSIFEEAFNALNENDVVIGPSLDGGYYLIGMNQFIPDLFEGITWSTEKVFGESKKVLESLGKTLYTLQPLNDIDNETDWNAYLSEIRA